MKNLDIQGISIPKLGLGTWQMRGDECRDAVARGIGLGYRHIDTAEMYDNEEGVGAGIKQSGIARADLHVTTKVWHENLAPARVRSAFDASMKKLGLDYVDLYLIHWPSADMNLAATLETIMRFKDEGRVKAVGVANFPVALLKQAVEQIGAPIACNQVEYHIYLGQDKLLDYMRSRGIALTAYCPLAKGEAADDAALAAIGRKHGASAAQVALKWLLDQEGVAAIPKASRVVSQQANLDALKITLDDEDCAKIAAFPKNRRLVNPVFAPAWD